MNDKSSAIGVALLATTLMIVYSGAPPPSSSLESLGGAETKRATKPALKAQPTEQRGNANGAIELIREFLGSSRKQNKDITPKNLATEYEVRCLIATIPDPEHSSLPFLFDAFLDAIQRAAETEDYVQDRIKLPWKKDREPIDPALTIEEKNAARTERKQMEQEPGIILFRRERKKELLVLFLVGETPTKGIYKDALKNALQQAHQYATGTTHEFKILGPAFSGSATSLSIAVRDWLQTTPKHSEVKLNFIGTATALDVANFTKEIQSGKIKAKEVEWHATVMQDEYARQAFYDYLLNTLATITKQPESQKAEGWYDYLRDKLGSFFIPTNAAYQVAFLTEGSTAYGRSQQTPPSSTSSPSSAPALSPNYHNRVLHLTFPLHISRLRSLTWKNEGNRTQGIKDPFNLSSSLTPLPMDEDEETTLPIFSAVAASYAEVTLATILEEIERQKIRYLGIIATDVRDRIFLAREIRRHSPNLVLFFLGSELLFLHPEINRDLQGSLLVSTYPLAPQSKLWSPSLNQQRKWLQFPVQSAQGVYNAALALLGRAEAMQEYEAPTFGQTSHGSTQRPALWLSVVGNDNIWPLTTLELRENGEYFQKFSPPERDKVIFPDQYLTLKPTPPPTATPLPSPSAPLEKPSGRERLHSEAAYIAFYLFVFAVCALPTYGVFAGLWGLLKKLFAFFSRNKSAKPLIDLAFADSTRKLTAKSKNLPLHWGWILLGELAEPRNDDLYLRRKMYLVGCLLAMLCLSLPVWLISAIPLNHTDYWESFTSIDQQLILGAFILSSLVVFLHFSRLWLIFRELVFWRISSDVVRYLLVYGVGGSLALFGLTVLFWLLNYTSRDEKGYGESFNAYWESFTNTALILILVIVGIVCILLLARRLKWLWTKSKSHSAPPSSPPQPNANRPPMDLHGYRKLDFVISSLFVLGLPLIALLLLVGLHFLPFYLLSNKARLILLWERTVGNFSGISPLMPLAFIATGTLTWALCCLRRLRLLERGSAASQNTEADFELKFLRLETNGTSSDAADEAETEGIGKLEERLHKMIRCPLYQLPLWGVTTAFVVIACIMMMGARLMPSVEGLWFNRGITVLFILAYLAIAFNFLRFLCIWSALRRLLRQLSWHPLLMGYRPPNEEKNAPLDCLRLDLSSPLPTFTALSKSVKQAQLLSHTDRAQSFGFADGRALIEKARAGLNAALNQDAANNWAEALTTRNEVRGHLIKLSQKVAEIIRPFWNKELHGGGDYRDKLSGNSLAAASPKPGPLLLKWLPAGVPNLVTEWQTDQAFLEQGERFLVSRLIGFLQYVLAQMQNLVVFVTLGILLMLGAVLSYPFQPMSPLLIFNWVTIVGVVTITMLVFVQMNRDRTLSLLSGTKPGEFEWNSQFILQVVLHGLLPLLAITGAQFSDSLHQFLTGLGVKSQGVPH